jgi:hypothetical protein
MLFIRQENNPSQNPQRPLFHLLGLSGGFIEARLKVSPAMLPRHGGFHTVCQDDELRWSADIMGAKAHDVDLSHSGRKIAKNRGEQGGLYRLSRELEKMKKLENR